MLNEHLGKINLDLGVQEELVLPTIDVKVEDPDQNFKIDDKDIEEYRELKKRREEEAIAKAKGGKKKKGEGEKEIKVKDDDEGDKKDVN